MRLGLSLSTVILSTIALAVSAGPLVAQPVADRIVKADVSRTIGAHSPAPLAVVGAGRAEEGLRADWQGQLATVQDEIGFRYLRMHGILNDEMAVYDEDKNGN